MAQKMPGYASYDVTITLETPHGRLDRAQIEHDALEVDRVLQDTGYEQCFGATTAFSFDPPRVTIDATIDAIDTDLVDRRVREIIETLNDHLEHRMDLTHTPRVQKIPALV